MAIGGEQGGIPADNLLGPEAGKFFKGPVHHDDAATGIDQHHGVASRFQDGLECFVHSLRKRRFQNMPAVAGNW